MKKIFSLDQIKFNTYLLIIILTIVAIIVYINIEVEATSYDKSFEISHNILYQEPIDFNDMHDGYLFYHPKRYLIVNKSDLTVNMEESNAIFTLFFGTDDEVESDYLQSINSDLTILYEYSEQTEDSLNYFYIWRYPTDSDEEYIQVMIGKNNRYIAGIFTESNKDKYISEMSYIFNSIKSVDESSNIGDNSGN